MSIITVDNAFFDDVVVLHLKKRLKIMGGGRVVMDGEYLYVRCCAHALNLVVSDCSKGK